MFFAIKKYIKSNRFLNSVVRFVGYPFLWLKSFYIRFRGYLREKGFFVSDRYVFLKQLQSSHKGERCFIVATGPSLTFDDLNLIKDEFSFGMNSCVLALDKTLWTPSILGIQDEYVYEKIENDILVASKDRLKGKIIVADTLADLIPSAKSFSQFPLDRLDRQFNHLRTGKILFSENCYSVVYDDYSIIFSLMQIAIYMGFSEIYLLGCDCTYKGTKKNFIDHGAIDPNFDIAGQRLIYIHSLFRKYAESHGVKVINCTRGGMLEEYPRMNLEDVEPTVLKNI